jgi:hypothetical protein
MILCEPRRSPVKGTLMSEPYVVFADHPGIRPREQDNPICFANCRAQGCFCGEPCIQQDVSTLRQAIRQGYTKAKNEAAYPPDWLDRTARICHHGLVLLALDQDPATRDSLEETPPKHETEPEQPAQRTTRRGRTKRREALDRTTVIEQLTSLRREVEAAHLPLVKFAPSFALVLSDVCRALHLTDREHDRVLGPQAAAYVADVRNRRWRPKLSQRLQQKRLVASRPRRQQQQQGLGTTRR